MSTEKTDANERVVDELLEAIWTCREEGLATVEQCLARSHVAVGRDALERMQQRGLVRLADEQVELTAAGETRARSIIRRHRLAERLLVDVLGMSVEQSEQIACDFEHTVVPEVTAGICTLLGHPEECPHGKPIPPGPDCEAGQTEVRQAIHALSEVPCSEQPVRVAYLRTGDHDRLHQLLSLGFAPGTELRIHQRTPVLVVQIDQSEFALDREVAGDVYVWTEADPL